MQHLKTPRGPRRRVPLILTSSQPRLKAQIRARTRELKQSQHLIQQILDLTPNGLCLFDTHQDRFVYVNRKNLEFFGVSAEEFLSQGQAFAEQHIHPDDMPQLNELYARLDNGAESASTQLRAKGCGEDWWWINFHGHVVERDAAQRPALILFVAEDITAMHQAAERLRYTSTHDALTGLYNWAYFEEALEQVRQNGKFPASIIMMDVDNLKTINDSIGHLAGDVLLRRISGLLQTAFRDGDILARLGGDEFAALLPGVDEDGARLIIRRIRTRLAEATAVSGVALDLLSIGLSTADTPDQLHHARHLADQDMYRDKQRRKNGGG